MPQVLREEIQIIDKRQKEVQDKLAAEEHEANRKLTSENICKPGFDKTVGACRVVVVCVCVCVCVCVVIVYESVCVCVCAYLSLSLYAYARAGGQEGER